MTQGDLAARIAGRLEALLVPLVLITAAAALAVPGPGRAIGSAGAIHPTLAVLVLTAGLSVEIAGLRRAAARWRRLLLVLAASSAGLPLLAWVLSRPVSGTTRDALLAVGVAPSEVASIALAGLAGAEAAVAAVLLAASSLVTVLAAGPILSLLTRAPALHPAGLLATLALVVALPLTAGAALRHMLPAAGPALPIGRILGTLSLLVLLWEVASQVHLNAAYLVATALLLVFLAGAAVLGAALSRSAGPAVSPAILLPTAMRDFAVAAGIAATAFGPASTAALGIYGLLVLLFGAITARTRTRAARSV